ncbi:MAG: hypothetical protein MO846_01310 [Candidatus Devosia symbiotica]|nr:hypothetical protein [Candidatus Devosia symbiotica]
MLRNATLEERIAWHIAHAQGCGCRNMPEIVKRALAERGIEPSRRPTD